MTGKAHAMAGLASGLLVADALDIGPVVSVGVCCLGSLIVDVDAPTSTINKLIPGSAKSKNIIKIILGCFLVFQEVFTVSILRYIGIIFILSSICASVEYRFTLWNGLEKRIYHRTLFHDPRIGIFLLSFPLFLLNMDKNIIIAYILGLCTHYLLDWLTCYGLPLYGSKRKFIRAPIYFKSNNSLVEVVIGVLLFSIITIKLGLLKIF